MSSIKDFKNKTSGKNYKNLIKENPDTVESLQENLKKYQNLNQQELYAELLKEASRLKQNGSLNENSLNMLKSTLSPMLNSEQNNILNSIINNIKW